MVMPAAPVAAGPDPNPPRDGDLPRDPDADRDADAGDPDAPREARWWLPRAELERLVARLGQDGREVVGPVVRDGAIVPGRIATAADLPHGVTDEQAPGRYRLAVEPPAPAPAATEHPARTFDQAASGIAWKGLTFPPTVPTGTATTTEGRVTFTSAEPSVTPRALLGVRACDLAAMAVQDRVLLQGPVVDADHAARRRDLLVVGVDCRHPASTCFCTSMGTGPEVTVGHDLALTELDEGFVVRSATAAGDSVVADLDLAPASDGQRARAATVPGIARAAMGEPLPMDGLPERLVARPEHPRWAAIAERCLACTGCTLACPTCFCTSVATHVDLAGTTATTERRWASCFERDFAAVAGGNFRARPADRYRQWLTHKLGTWVTQFGTSGCVGCGRCITWCPVGIDVREELRIITAPPVVVRGRPEPAAQPTTPGLAAVATIVSRRRETVDTWTLTLEDVPGSIRGGAPGQFLMVEQPGFPAAPISVSRYRPESIELTVRAAGPATRALTAATPGTTVGLRGPLGRGWPLAAAVGRDVLVVAGGIGLAPVRPLVEGLLAERSRFGAIRLAVGARTPEDLLLRDDLAAWSARRDLGVEVTVDCAGPDWAGGVGVVTQLFDRAPMEPVRTVAYLCGPEKMMQVAAHVLAGRGVPADRVWLSTERHMECGVGLCGHCQLGRFFVCRDGPVFSRAELGDAFELEGI